MNVEFTPFRFDEEGTKLLKALNDVITQTEALIKAFKDEGLDVADAQAKYDYYKELMGKIYDEYKHEG